MSRFLCALFCLLLWEKNWPSKSSVGTAPLCFRSVTIFLDHKFATLASFKSSVGIDVHVHQCHIFLLLFAMGKIWLPKSPVGTAALCFFFRDMPTIRASQAVGTFAGRFQPEERQRVSRNLCD